MFSQKKSKVSEKDKNREKVKQIDNVEKKEINKSEKDDISYKNVKVVEESEKNYGKSVIWSLILIFIGILLLLNSIGILSWSIWLVIFKLWPVLFILEGLNIAFGKSKIASCIVGIFLFLLMFFILLIMLTSSGAIKLSRSMNDLIKNTNINIIENGKKKSTFELSKNDFDDVGKMDLSFKVGASKIKIDTNENERFYKIDSTYYDGFGEPDINYEKTGETLKIDFSQKSQKILFVSEKNPYYEVNLGTNMPTAFKFELGAGDGEINFGNGKFGKIFTKVGAGHLKINISEPAEFNDEISFEIGVGDVVIYVPKSYAVKLSYELGLGSIKVFEKEVNGFGKESNWKSKNYDNTDYKLNVFAKVGVGSFKINYY